MVSQTTSIRHHQVMTIACSSRHQSKKAASSISWQPFFMRKAVQIVYA